MKKLFTSLLAFGLFWSNVYSQIYIDESFDSNIPATWSTSSEQDAFPWHWSDAYGWNSDNIDGTGFVIVDADAAGSANNLVENLDSPGFDASGGNIIIVEFDHVYQEYIDFDTAMVQVWNGTEWNTAWQAYNNSVGSWLDPTHTTVIISDLINPSGDTKVRFRYDDGNTYAWYWAIDNVVISSVDCLEPQNITIATGAIAATVEWDSGSGNSDLIWGIAGFDPLSEGTLVNAASNPYTITGLDPSSSYDVYLRDNCGINGYSEWIGPINFYTTIACPEPLVGWDPFTNPTSEGIDITFTQNFGDVYLIVGPENFVLGSSGDTIGPVISPYTITGLDPLSFYDVYLFMDCNGDGLGSSFTIGSYSFNTLVDGPGTGCGDPIILNGNLPWTSTEQSICGYGNNITTSPCPIYSGYEEIVFAYAPESDGEILGIFADNFTSSEYYFTVTDACPSDPDANCVASGSWYSWDGGSNFLMNDVELVNGTTYFITVTGYLYNACTLDLSIFLVTCLTPVNPSFTAFADYTEIDWVSASEDAAGWTLEWGPEGFAQGTGTIIDGTYGVDGPPISIDGLSDAINYEFYVTDLCGFGDQSIPLGPVLFTGPPPINDLCANAISIECGSTTPGNTASATDVGNSSSSCDGWSYAQGPVVWYTFEGTGTEIILSTCGANFDTQIFVYTGACGDDLECAGYGDGNWYNNTNQCANWGETYMSMGTIEGETYTVAVTAWGTTETGSFDLVYECIPCSAPNNLLLVTNSDTQAEFSWSSFNGPGTTYTYEYGTAGFTLGTGTSGTGDLNVDGPPVTISGLSASTTYDFYVWESCTDGSESEALLVTFVTNALPPPANDLCADAITLECGETGTASTLNATSFGNPMGGLCGNAFNIMEGNTVWWQFVGTGEEVLISTCGSNFYTDLFIMTGSCDDMECVVQSAYNSGPCGDWYSTEVSIMAELGQTYYISVSPDGTWTDGGDVTVSIECIPCSTPTNVTASLTDVSATIGWTSFNAPADYTLIWGPAGFDYPTDPGTVITGNSGVDYPVLIDGLSPGVLYDVYIFEYCESELTNSDTVFYSFITNALPPPANDNACNADALTDGVVLETTNIYASVEIGEPAPAAGNCNDPNQMTWCQSGLTSSTWYTFTPDMNGMATVTTCHTGSYDTQMAMYMVDDCSDMSSFTLVAANDDNNTCQVATGFTSTIQICLQGGITYYIQVDPYNEWGNPTGEDFSISVEFEGAGVSNFSAFPSPNTAAINWTYSADSGNDVDFTLYYTNLSTNEVVMVNGNTADLPIVLDGLDNLTQYEYYVVCGDDCETTSIVNSFTTLANGITELNFGSTVNVYPNPVSDILTIEINAKITAGSVISIISMQGQVIYSETVKDNVSEYRTEIDVDNYARGMYLLKLEDENASIQQRIIVQ